MWELNDTVSCRVEFESLIGERILDAVDETEVVFREKWMLRDEKSCAIRFRLDGITYIAVEDPQDDYRSSMRCLLLTPEDPVNVFFPCSVRVQMTPDDDHQRNHSIEMIDAITGKLVLKVGTDNWDDYYPYFVGYFDPKAMAANSGK